jgi:hypothetical protein
VVSKLAINLCCDLAVVSEKLLKVLWAEDVDLCEQKLTLHKRRLGVIQDSPDGDEVLELAAGLLDDAILSGEHNCHAGEVLDLGVAHDKTVDVEAAGSENPRNTGEHSRLILNQAVEDVACWRCFRGSRSLVEDIGDGSLGGPCWGILCWEGCDAAVKGLVRKGRGR